MLQHGSSTFHNVVLARSPIPFRLGEYGGDLLFSILFPSMYVQSAKYSLPQSQHSNDYCQPHRYYPEHPRYLAARSATALAATYRWACPRDLLLHLQELHAFVSCYPSFGSHVRSDRPFVIRSNDVSPSSDVGFSDRYSAYRHCLQQVPVLNHYSCVPSDHQREETDSHTLQES